MTFGGGSRSCMCVILIAYRYNGNRTKWYFLSQWFQIFSAWNEYVSDTRTEYRSTDILTSWIEVVLTVLISTFKISPAKETRNVVWNLANVRYPTLGETSNKPSLPLLFERLKLLWGLHGSYAVGDYNYVFPTSCLYLLCLHTVLASF